jgi:peptidoglycan hydrolase-like protein with peptidoglycan-binding domain
MSQDESTAPIKPHRRGSEAVTILIVVVAVVAVLAMVVADRLGSSGGTTSADRDQVAAPAAGGAAPGEGAAAAPTTVAAGPEQLQELDAAAAPAAAPAATPAVAGDCVMEVLSLRMGATGNSVVCLQQALAKAGLYSGAPSGSFDDATYIAVRKVQESRSLFVDGVVGRETALSLGVWPDEQSFVVHTPAPAPGAKDSMGYPLSSVASTGASAPPLPANSGSGRRVVYDRAGQRVWAVDKNNNVIRSWLVSGSQYSNEVPGTHKVYSRSAVSTAWNGKAYLPKMIRYYQTKIGHIGFHAIPLKVSDRSAYQTEAQLGTRLSGGCQRQANLDAAFLWDFAQVGTTVVVT